MELSRDVFLLLSACLILETYLLFNLDVGVYPSFQFLEHMLTVNAMLSYLLVTHYKHSGQTQNPALLLQ